MAFAAARMILKDKRRKSKEDFAPPRQRSKVEHVFPLLDIFVSISQVFQPRTYIYISFVFPTKRMMMFLIRDRIFTCLKRYLENPTHDKPFSIYAKLLSTFSPIFRPFSPVSTLTFLIVHFSSVWFLRLTGRNLVNLWMEIFVLLHSRRKMFSSCLNTQ